MKATPEILKQRQSLDLDAKVAMSLARIRAWHDHWDNIHVTFSGGKDSLVVLHLVRSIYPDTPAVFFDTGLEFPEVRAFVKTFSNITWLKPKMTFKAVLEKYGYPIIGKRTARYIEQVKRADDYTPTVRLRLTGITSKGSYSPMSKIAKKWQYLCGAPFKISAKCCDIFKRNPADLYEKETGSRPILGTMASESELRRFQYFDHGCNAFHLKHPLSSPIAFWLEEDVWAYLDAHNIPHCPIYDMGYERTGCVFCMFGVHFDKPPNRFQRLASTHPKLHNYCINKLGCGRVLDYIGVPYEKVH